MSYHEKEKEREREKKNQEEYQPPQKERRKVL